MGTEVIAWEMASEVSKGCKIDLLIGRRRAFLFQSLRRLLGEERIVFLNISHGGHIAHTNKNDVMGNTGAEDVLGKVWMDLGIFLMNKSPEAVLQLLTCLLIPGDFQKSRKI